MKTFLILICVSFFSNAQIISQFNWDSNPITTAVVGPNGTSAGGTATSSTGGVGGTNGLNPGSPSPASDINLNVPNTGNVFDVPNIDVSIDYRRNETTAQMVKRGTFTFNTGGTVANFRVTYRVATGGTVTTVTSTAVAIPSDATFRNYRFTYDNCSGVGTMYVNSAVVWTCSPTTPGQDLYWVGDGALVIGQDMDGANNNIPNLDNFVLKTYTCSGTLPVELTSFTGSNQGTRNYLEWKTASEKNSDFFTLERSTDGQDWTFLTKMYAAGNSGSEKNYGFYDAAPVSGLNYYQLKQTDFNGESKKFSIIVVDNSPGKKQEIIKVTDILGREMNSEFSGPCLIFYSDGKVVKRFTAAQ